MEYVHGNGASGELRTGAATNLGEGEQFNPRNTATETHPEATSSPSHDQRHSPFELHNTFPAMEQAGGSTINTNLGTRSDNTHSSLSGNPFSLPTIAASKAEQEHGSMTSSDLRADPVSVLGEAGVSNPDNKSGSSLPPFSTASESLIQDPNNISSDDDDIPISSMPKHGQKSNDVSGQFSPNWEFNPDNGSTIQTPPVQVMERPEDPGPEPGSPSSYRIPSHVFDRSKSNVPEWSTASNESLFSIHMGNMSFSKDLNLLGAVELGYLGKSGEMNMMSPVNNELGKVGDDISMSPPPNAFTSNQGPVNMFNDINQNSGVTEAKAAETMREVIRETIENDVSFVGGVPTPDGRSNSHDHSQHSDGSTKSFAFKALADDKSASSRGVKAKQQRQTERETPKATPNAGQAQAQAQAQAAAPAPAPSPKPTTHASYSRWLCCFSCCSCT